MLRLGARRLSILKYPGWHFGWPELYILTELVEAVRVPVIGAGGVPTIEKPESAQAYWCGGAIIGQALYTGAIDLKQAITVRNKDYYLFILPASSFRLDYFRLFHRCAGFSSAITDFKDVKRYFECWSSGSRWLMIATRVPVYQYFHYRLLQWREEK